VLSHWRANGPQGDTITSIGPLIGVLAGGAQQLSNAAMASMKLPQSVELFLIPNSLRAPLGMVFT
jgi:hypothetical protein